MSDIFCCKSYKPYKSRRLDHEAKFKSFMDWVETDDSATSIDVALSDLGPPFAVQLVRQVNFGPLESKRYFVPTAGQDGPSKEITEAALVQANFQKLNTFKNFKCDAHNKFFEVNLYQKDPVNKHHWRSDVARPGISIDL